MPPVVQRWGVLDMSWRRRRPWGGPRKHWRDDLLWLAWEHLCVTGRAGGGGSTNLSSFLVRNQTDGCLSPVKIILFTSIYLNVIFTIHTQGLPLPLMEWILCLMFFDGKNKRKEDELHWRRAVNCFLVMQRSLAAPHPFSPKASLLLTQTKGKIWGWLMGSRCHMLLLGFSCPAGHRGLWCEAETIWNKTRSQRVKGLNQSSLLALTVFQ